MDGNNTRNLFLSSLSPMNRQHLVRRSTAVPLPVPTVLFEAGEIPDYAYFMTSGLASVVSDMKDGAAVEVGMHGREGVVSAFQLLGSKASPMRCFMQIGGSALRISMGDLRAAFQSSEEIREKLLENIQKESLILGQVAACNRLHEAEERLARWLLMVQDRTQSDVLELTQEFLAEMLGARRATVTIVAGALQRAGLIEYHRGRVKIVDREGLETAACDCYRIVHDLRGDVYNGNCAAGSF